MSYDRFNHNVDRRVKTKAAPLQRVEVITGVERRREWSDEEKLAIIAESCQEGAVISDVARRHGLRPQQLFTWRNGLRKREAARRLCGGASGGMPAFAPVTIAGERPAVAPVETPAVIAGACQIEIVLGRATVRLHGGVDAKNLAAVLHAVKAIA
jgi:transposase